MPGDKLCLFDGSESFHIVRKQGFKPIVYQLVGELWLHGMMSGEAEALGLENVDINLV
jgi:hypothetical protein